MWIDISWRQPQKLWEKLGREMTLRQEKRQDCTSGWRRWPQKLPPVSFLLPVLQLCFLLPLLEGNQPGSLSRFQEYRCFLSVPSSSLIIIWWRPPMPPPLLPATKSPTNISIQVPVNHPLAPLRPNASQKHKCKHFHHKREGRVHAGCWARTAL